MDDRAATRDVLNTYKRKRFRNSSSGFERKQPKNGCPKATSRNVEDYEYLPLIIIKERATSGEHQTPEDDDHVPLNIIRESNTSSMTTNTSTIRKEEQTQPLENILVVSDKQVDKQFIELVNQGSIREEQLQHGVRDTLPQTQASQVVEPKVTTLEVASDDAEVREEIRQLKEKIEVPNSQLEIRQLKEKIEVLKSQLEKTKADNGKLYGNVQDYNSEKVISRGTKKLAGKKKVAANQHSQMSNARAPHKNTTSGPSRVFALDSTRHATFSHRVSHPLCPTLGNVPSVGGV